MRFYLIAMIFIIFDIEIVFLYPWAVIFRQLRSFGLTEVVVFAAVVFISFLYLIAMIFIIFDIEIIFLYPWAVVFRQLQTFGLVEILVFAGIVFVSLLYLVSNGALTWGPSKTLQSGMPPRTSESTISRISAQRSQPGQAA